MPKKPAAPTSQRRPATGRGQGKGAAAPVKKLTDLEQRFVDEYLTDLNGSAAYLRVAPNVTPGTARTTAARLLAKAHIQAAVAAGRARLQDNTGVTAERVIKEAWSILTADPRELMEFRVGCCRYCWGEGFRYQRTDGELEAARLEHAARRAAAKTTAERNLLGVFNEQGGGGYHRARNANADCPQCAGEGVGRTVFHDTRKISSAAASLFAGVKEGKEGLELKVHSKDAVMERLFKHFGLFEKDNAQNAPIVVVKDMTGRKSA